MDDAIVTGWSRRRCFMGYMFLEQQWKVSMVPLHVLVETKDEPTTESTVPDHGVLTPEERTVCSKSIMVDTNLGSGLVSHIPVVDDLIEVSPVAIGMLPAMGMSVPPSSAAASPVPPQSELQEVGPPLSGLSQPETQSVSPVLVIHDISFQLRSSVQDALESLADLFVTFKEIRFLPVGRRSTIELKSPEEICEFVTVAWDEFSKAGMESRAFQDAIGFQPPPEAFTQDLVDLQRCGSLICSTASGYSRP